MNSNPERRTKTRVHVLIINATENSPLCILRNAKPIQCAKPMLNLRLLQLLHILKEVQERACAPSLSSTRVSAVRAILVCQLRDSSPRIALDVLTGSEQNAMQEVKRLLRVFLAAPVFGIKNEVGSQEVA